MPKATTLTHSVQKKRPDSKRSAALWDANPSSSPPRLNNIPASYQFHIIFAPSCQNRRDLVLASPGLEHPLRRARNPVRTPRLQARKLQEERHEKTNQLRSALGCPAFRDSACPQGRSGSG